MSDIERLIDLEALVRRAIPILQQMQEVYKSKVIAEWLMDAEEEIGERSGP